MRWRSSSNIKNVMIVWGPIRIQLGMKPLYSPRGPSDLKVFKKQSKAFLYTRSWCATPETEKNHTPMYYFYFSSYESISSVVVFFFRCLVMYWMYISFSWQPYFQRNSRNVLTMLNRCMNPTPPTEVLIFLWSKGHPWIIYSIHMLFKRCIRIQLCLFHKIF